MAKFERFELVKRKGLIDSFVLKLSSLD